MRKDKINTNRNNLGGNRDDTKKIPEDHFKGKFLVMFQRDLKA